MNNKFDNIDGLINDIDYKLEKLNEKELKGKTKEEQEILKEQWNKEIEKIAKNQSEKNFKKQQEVLDFIDNSKNNIIPIEELTKQIREWKQQLDDDYKKVMNDVMNNLLMDSSPESQDLYKKLLSINKGK